MGIHLLSAHSKTAVLLPESLTHCPPRHTIALYTYGLIAGRPQLLSLFTFDEFCNTQEDAFACELLASFQELLFDPAAVIRRMRQPPPAPCAAYRSTISFCATYICAVPPAWCADADLLLKVICCD
eukprot:2445791-Pleurochrysis_carterae.AAC.1